MIPVNFKQIEKNIPKKQMAFKVCPFCGSIRTHEYKNTSIFLCGTNYIKETMPGGPYLNKSIQCQIIEELKVSISIERRGKVQTNFLTIFEADYLNVSLTDKQTGKTILTNRYF